MPDWTKLLGNEGAVLSAQAHKHIPTHTQNAPLHISAYMHLVAPVLMQDLIHKTHTDTRTYTQTPSEYISASWTPTQLSRLTFCLVFFPLPHTFCLYPPSLSSSLCSAHQTDLTDLAAHRVPTGLEHHSVALCWQRSCVRGK